MEKLYIDGSSLTLNDVIDVARYFKKIEISEASVEKINKARKYVDDIVEGKKVVYGITTGFGKFSDVVIDADQTADLQVNLIRSHSCGVGKPLPVEVVRAAMLLRINALSKGNSGIRFETLSLLVDMLNANVHPIIPEKGSLGASGDLAPLSHMVLVMLGEGEAEYKGERLSGQEALNRAGLKSVSLTSKEGLALINGTQILTAVGALATYDAINLVKLSDISAALTFEALYGITSALDHKIHKVRNHDGQMECAENLLRLLEGSNYTTVQGELRTQDAYSLRCTPQIHGASRDAIKYVLDKVEKEINAATDNPLIFVDEDQVFSGGNFHGQPMAIAFDFLAIAVSELANVSERRIERLVNPQLSNDLPAFLTENGGVNSGFMIMQYAAAALVSENKVLAHPASVDSIPSSANQEDHVSMGTIAARKAYDIVNNVKSVLAIELLAATQGIDLREKNGLGKGTKPAYDALRANVKKLELDRIMNVDIDKVTDMINSGVIVKAVESSVGNLFLGGEYERI